MLILGILGAVATFGVTATLYGLWQIRTGQRNRRIIYFLLGIFTLLVWIADVI